MGFSIGKALKSVAKVAAAPFTAGASLQGGSIGDIFSNGVSNLVQGAVGLGTDYLQSQYNLAAQKDLAAYTAQQQNALNEAAYQRNLAQWNLENAYNSPVEQMKRYEAAGLNKNLIYGQQNTSASSPTLQSATYDPGIYHPVDKSAQRQALQLALLEHGQRIENQAIQNDLARQRLALAQRASDRADYLAQAHVQDLTAKNINLTKTVDIDKYFDKVEQDQYRRLRNEKMRRDLENRTGLPGTLNTLWQAGKAGAGILRKGKYIEKVADAFKPRWYWQ